MGGERAMNGRFADTRQFTPTGAPKTRRCPGSVAPVGLHRNETLQTLVLLFRVTFLSVLLGLSVGLDRSFAQGDVAPELLDRPPVAAPTSKIQVDAIPVVLSEGQEADNYVAGLLRGLLAQGSAKGAAVVVVENDHVMMQRNIGTVAPNTRFPTGALSGAFDTIAAMQLIERGRLSADDDLGKALGETSSRGMTLAQILTRQAGELPLVASAVAKVTGTSADDDVVKEIAQPLAMSATGPREGQLETTLTDMSHLAIALVNSGAFQNGRILEPATVEQMESTHFTPHPALPGWAYGFAEIRRNGWRGLQQEGVAGSFASRLVIVPDAKLAYFIVTQGPTGASFWRALDDGLFDKLMAPRRVETTTGSTPAPTEGDARAVAGVYEPARDMAASLAGLKLGGRISVRAADDGALILSGVENARLSPRPGGYWGTADGNLNGVARDGRLLLSTGPYRPLALYKRPGLYAWLAMLAALASAGAIYYERRKHPGNIFPSDSVLGLASASAALVLASVLAWLFAPVA